MQPGWLDQCCPSSDWEKNTEVILRLFYNIEDNSYNN